MEGNQKQRKRDRLKQFLSPKKNPSVPKHGADRGNKPSSATMSPDRARTQKRYEIAAEKLQSALKMFQNEGQPFEFPDLKGELDELDNAQLTNKIEQILENHARRIEDPSALARCRRGLESAYRAFSPFAKSFLKIAQDCQSVSLLLAFPLTSKIQVISPYGLLFGGLLAVIQVKPNLFNDDRRSQTTKSNEKKNWTAHLNSYVNNSIKLRMSLSLCMKT
jgi:hypothetical protein